MPGALPKDGPRTFPRQNLECNPRFQNVPPPLPPRPPPPRRHHPFPPPPPLLYFYFCFDLQFTICNFAVMEGSTGSSFRAPTPLTWRTLMRRSAVSGMVLLALFSLSSQAAPRTIALWLQRSPRPILAWC